MRWDISPTPSTTWADKLNKNGEYQRQFISNVSHDFRSPLTSIKGYVEAMLDGTIPPEMQERYLKVIAFESTRLEKLTRSLLTLNELDVKKRMMHMRRFDINETIRTTAASFEGTCSERIPAGTSPWQEKNFLSVRIWSRSSRYCTIYWTTP